VDQVVVKTCWEVFKPLVGLFLVETQNSKPINEEAARKNNPCGSEGVHKWLEAFLIRLNCALDLAVRYERVFIRARSQANIVGENFGLDLAQIPQCLHCLMKWANIDHQHNEIHCKRYLK